MTDPTDQELLRAYAQERAEAAFAELVRRHVDFVHSVAWRIVRDEASAQDVTQSVFVALAANARKLAGRTVLAGWLHITTQNLAASAVRTDVRRRAREQEAAAMNESSQDESAIAWEQIAPELDRAIGQLSEEDRDALLLRYFQNKSIREMAGALATSEEAAQKRALRALERLRKIMARRGVAAGATGLAAVVAANAVKAAPVGVGRASLAEGLRAGAGLSTNLITKGTMMWQKVVSAASTVAVIATAWYAMHLNGEMRALRAEEAGLHEQLAQTQRDLDDARGRLALRQSQGEGAEKNVRELARLRAEVARLRDATNTVAEAVAIEPEVRLKAPPLQVVTEAKFAEVPNDKLGLLGITWTDDGDGTKHSLLTSNDLQQMKQSFSDNDIDVLSSPKVTTLSGRQASLSSTSTIQLNDTNVSVGPSLSILANFSTNDLTFTLDVSAQLTELVGDPMEVFDLVLTNEATFARGQTVVLAREMPTNSWAPDHTKSPAVPSTLVVAVRPELIDPAGNVVLTHGKMLPEAGAVRAWLPHD